MSERHGLIHLVVVNNEYSQVAKPRKLLRWIDFLDGLARYRASEGEKAMSVHLKSMVDVEFLAENPAFLESGLDPATL
jgi:hypothetical protein